MKPIPAFFPLTWREAAQDGTADQWARALGAQPSNGLRWRYVVDRNTGEIVREGEWSGGSLAAFLLALARWNASEDRRYVPRLPRD